MLKHVLKLTLLLYLFEIIQIIVHLLFSRLFLNAVNLSNAWLFSNHCSFIQAEGIRENIGYPDFLTNKTALASLYKGVSMHSSALKHGITA